MTSNPLLRLHSLSELRLRRARLLELVAEHPDAFGGWLDATVDVAHRGDGEAAHTLVAWASALAHLDQPPAWDRWLEAVDESVDEDVPRPGACYLRLLAGPPGHPRLSPRVKLEAAGWVRGLTTPAGRPFHGREYVSESATRGAPDWLTASEQARIERHKRRARHQALGLLADRHPWSNFQRPHHDVIERAYRHDDPRFRARLLERSWLVERDVVLMASLRPSTEAMLLTIVRSDRWFFHEAVRDALCNNPFAPSWLVGSLLPAARNTTRRALLRHPDPLLVALADAWQQRPLEVA